IWSRQSGAAIAASSGRGKHVGYAGGLVQNRSHLVIVPAVRIIVHDDDGRAAPIVGLLDCVDGCYDELLLIERVRVAGVAVLVGRGFQEANRWQIAVLEGGEEIGDVVLVVGHTVEPDFGDRRWGRVAWVRRGGVVVEQSMVSYVVGCFS